MKTIILLFSLAFIFPANSILDPVLDAHGKYLRPGVKYRVKPALSDGDSGGLIMRHLGNESCPLAVGQAQNQLEKGLWLSFTPANPKERVIRVSTDVNIKFSGSNSCNESNVWRLKYNEFMEVPLVMAGGVEGNPGPKTLYNWFKLEKSSYTGYKFYFCPSICSHCEFTCGDLVPMPSGDFNGKPFVLFNNTNSWGLSFIFY